jgi:hypothetical protein
MGLFDEGFGWVSPASDGAVLFRAQEWVWEVAEEVLHILGWFAQERCFPPVMLGGEVMRSGVVLLPAGKKEDQGHRNHPLWRSQVGQRLRI